MKVGRVALLCVAAFLLSLALLNGRPQRALADHVSAHMLFLQQDQAWRDLTLALAQPYSAFKFNAVNAWWAAWNLTTTWDAEPGLKDVARNAINRWKDPATNPNAVPQLRFQEGGDQFPLRLWIHDGTCQFSQHISCVRQEEIVFAIVEESPPGSGNVLPGALYWWSSHIHVVLSQTGWTDPGKTDAITHEVGHWIGLHEQYAFPVVACNQDDINGGLSVMNLGRTDTGNCRGVHMPSAWDKTTVTRFWTGDAVQNAVLTGSRSVLALEWTNKMWGGGPHGGFLYRYVCEELGCSWEMILPQWQTWERVGFHRDAFDIGRLRMTWNQPCGSWYGAYVSEYSFLFSQWAPWQWAQVSLSC